MDHITAVTGCASHNLFVLTVFVPQPSVPYPLCLYIRVQMSVCLLTDFLFTGNVKCFQQVSAFKCQRGSVNIDTAKCFKRLAGRVPALGDPNSHSDREMGDSLSRMQLCVTRRCISSSSCWLLQRTASNELLVLRRYSAVFNIESG